MLIVPERLATACQSDALRSAWLRQLPDLICDLEARWSIEVGQPFDSATCAWVAPLRQGHTDAVLKLGLPHFEAHDEIEGLRFWNGDGAVRLLAADEEYNAMLLERCHPGTTLRELPEPEQDAVIAACLRRLWRKPQTSHRFRPLSAMFQFWSEEARQVEEHWPDRTTVADGLQLFAELSLASHSDVLLATDLHAGNVLRSQRQPWLVIDPKPFVGDPAYDVTQHLLNCRDRLLAGPPTLIERLANLLALDRELIRLWTFARAAVQAGCSWKDARWLELAHALAHSFR